ncbi:putative N-formylglutamate amidohydrolase [Hasllibacter halocynthiae]|uniref:Putative N-formylglutamate amidohydrolase n=1 Tax=Hasllibacter halocynthiae TaxID=595589 RepID=A0A2T0X3X3_9RHOB|nr:N-formylglutamate amidohydrolase [Hasllibacter halocynthiae]PRY93653.1 putative N-formylglutamate amidohydrolase [Hasllibacter halocynthiae]
MDAFRITGADRPGPWVVTVDHAMNRVPPGVGPLGLPDRDMRRHIAWDPGALGTALALGETLGAPVVASTYSRLVIDPNRGEDDPTLLMKLYDGTPIPGNRRAGTAERERRLRLFHRPYHDAVARLMARPGAILLAIHTFTPRLRGRPPRPWEVGILSARDRRLADPLLRLLRAEGLTVGDNEPYTGALPGDSVDRHALSQGRPNALVELRNDLVATPEGERAWAARLAPVLEAARAEALPSS